MLKSTDEHGRIHLSIEVRERFGEQYRIIELPSHVALFPVDDAPLEGLREAVGDAFEGENFDQLETDTRKQITDELHAEGERRSQEQDE